MEMIDYNSKDNDRWVTGANNCANIISGVVGGCVGGDVGVGVVDVIVPVRLFIDVFVAVKYTSIIRFMVYRCCVCYILYVVLFFIVDTICCSMFVKLFFLFFFRWPGMSA